MESIRGGSGWTWQRVLTVVTAIVVFGVLILAVLAYSSPWFQLEIANKTYGAGDGSTVVSFTWDAVMVQDTRDPDTIQIWDYDSLTLFTAQAPAESADALTQVTVTWLSFGLLCWTMFALLTAAVLVGICAPRVALHLARMRVAHVGLCVGCCGALWLMAAWITYCFLPLALNHDFKEEDCFALHACNSLSGSDFAGSWGPVQGWAFALVASACGVFGLCLWAAAFFQELTAGLVPLLLSRLTGKSSL